ncbi:hypothetical protein BU14_0022s0102 [Porphyra umbilicalis]|uniref:Metallo-beta-lactamase domain-containing protein n=1 Tax=Porphyra umbilicalis TaxID=2786 RepID=A0A1X6PKL8_PORUM|nr:hypothetical protein BU14_0022s0102 [Porphyra umbilicalis]|eukprot:OSX81382.1 hypothetical protein BU14_0022s0102 [Porphyra umbilicalis]
MAPPPGPSSSPPSLSPPSPPPPPSTGSCGTPPPPPLRSGVVPPPPPGAATVTTLTADGRAFTNPFPTFPGLPRPRRFLTLLTTRSWYGAAATSLGVGRWYGAASAAVTAAFPPVRLTAGALAPPRLGAGRMTWLGHGSVLLQAGPGAAVLVDPVFGRVAGPRRAPAPVRLQPPPFDGVPHLRALLAEAGADLSAVAITHAHYDHAEAAAVAALAAAFPAAAVVVPLGLGAWVTGPEVGVPPARVTELAWWGSVTLPAAGGPAGAAAAAAAAAATAGWGDLAAAAAAAPAGGGRVHGAAVPIGATHPRALMRAQHMDAAEAVAAVAAVGADVAVAVHWGTFVLTTEGVLEPVAALARANARVPGGGVLRAVPVGMPVEVVGDGDGGGGSDDDRDDDRDGGRGVLGRGMTV